MSSDRWRQRAVHVVAALRAQLDQRRIAEDIDQPIDHALATFRFDWQIPTSISQFHGVSGALVAHVYAHGLIAGRVLSPTQAAAEALELLEIGYQGTHAPGYDGAVLDALTPRGSGIDAVLARLAEIVKVRQRHRHRQRTLIRYLDPLNWPLRCAVVDVIVKERCAAGDTTLAAQPPARFVDHIPDLLDSALHAETMLDQLVAAALSKR